MSSRATWTGEIPPGEWAVNGWDPAAVGTSTSLDVRTGPSLITEINHPWEMLFKGSIWISRCHSLLRLLLVYVWSCLLFINKMYKSVWKRSYVFLHITEVIEVTQEIIDTGIIPLEPFCAPQRKGLTPYLLVHRVINDLYPCQSGWPNSLAKLKD